MIDLIMEYSKSTKTTHVYSAEDAGIEKLYIKKTAFPNPNSPPNVISVIVTDGEEELDV